MIQIGLSEITSIITLIIVGWVFYIQKKQIEQQKDVISSMKNFIEIFKVDEVKKYVQLKEDIVEMKFEKMIKNDVVVKEMISEVSKNTLGKVEEFYKEKTGEKINELFSFCLLSLKEFKEDERELFLKNHFIKTGDTLKKALSELH